ncbi:MAG TPA: threo-3-hydroxy-L-aspartate ammonia-lyase [Rhizobiaceae bacterium]|nr:threo-3-hydroxy-L-aspartate ammonia-lyase [Rhizobiaceae bacterium]
MSLPTFDSVLAARSRIAGIAHKTPVLTSRTADTTTGATLFFKAENLQRGGAFKFRGAYNAIAALDDAARKKGVLAFSSGNHAQAIAYAAKLQGAPAVIIMPSDAPSSKIAGTKGYGAEVVLYDRYTEDREALSKKIATERGMALIPPFDHPDVAAGQGTAALELIEEVGPLDMMVTPLGGGGLLSGTTLATRELAPFAEIYGVEPEAGNDGQQSLAKGEVVTIPVPKSIADGALTMALGKITFPIIKETVKAIVTVSDAELIEQMKFFLARMKILVEPTGCLAAAAVMTGKLPVKGKRVGVILSGGNVDLAAVAKMVAG